MYYFIDIEKRKSGGWGPKLRKHVGFSQLAEPKDPARFALYSVRKLPKKAITKHIQQVSWPLWALLLAAEAYPPALAICREEISRMDIQTTKEFEVILMERLQFHCARQVDSPYFLAKSTREDPGYKWANAYYWIIGYRPERIGREVAWVSGDYWVYCDSINDFEIDSEWLAKRFFKP